MKLFLYFFGQKYIKYREVFILCCSSEYMAIQILLFLKKDKSIFHNIRVVNTNNLTI